MVVTDGYRTLLQQQRLYALGRLQPGKIVTNCDGVRVRSRHQDGEAADCAFVAPDGRITWEGDWELYARVAEWYGLEAGGHWTGFKDRPHIQLPRPSAASGLRVASGLKAVWGLRQRGRGGR